MGPRLASCCGGLLALGVATTAQAQDDGPRVYQLQPVGAKTFTAFAVAKRSNEGPEPGSVSPGTEIDTNILIFRYTQTFDLAGRALAPFVILPFGEVKATGAPTSSGLGDMQIGATLGLFGSPALSRQAYAAYRPRFGTSVLARVYFPTGEYKAAKPVNLGANRVSYQLGLPTVLAWGASYRDPALTSWEILPTLTFYEPNNSPFGASRVSKAPLFSVESHLTHNLGQRVWISADLLWRRGGETRTDGLSDGNAMRGWSAGGSFAFPLAQRASLILTYEQVIARNDDGPDGWFFRTALVAPF